MKKNFYKRFALAALLAIGCTQVANAQIGNTSKRYAFGDGKNYVQAMETNADVNVHQIDGCIVTTFNRKPYRNTKTGAATHTLSVFPPEGSDHWNIYVASGDTYYNQYAYFFGGDGLIDEVEEDIYDILVTGTIVNDTTDFSFCITYDQVEVNEDLIIQATLGDCPYRIKIDSHTPDGTPMSELNYTHTSYRVHFNWLGQGIQFMQMSYTPNLEFSQATYFEYLPYFRSSAFDERSSISLAEIQFAENQTCYFINHEPIAGCSGDIVFESNGEDLKVHEEYYHVNTTDTSYYHVDDMIIGTGWAENHSHYVHYNIFNSSLPLTVVSNLKIEDTQDFSHGYLYVMAPKVIETRDWENQSWPEYKDDFITSLMYYNAEDKLVRQPFHHYKNILSSFYNNESYPDFLTPTPMDYFGEFGEKLFFGYRTPVVYQQTFAFNKETSPMGEGSFIVRTTMFGENSIWRVGDSDALIHISLDGEEIYCDSLYKYLYTSEYPFEQPGIVSVDITDKHLVVEGVEKTNTTHTEFDLSRDDAMPPTMTILQVKNKYGTESIEIVDWANAQIVFAAGDFEPHYKDFGYGGYFDKMQFKAKPNVDVYYSVENGEWQPLEYTENDELFHVNYGNIFTIDLAQLDANVTDKWVNLKFVVTDEAGNSQTQTMENVFYAGGNVSVNEHSAASLEHAVYPNPFSGEVRITAAQDVNGVANIAVYNILGELVYSKTQNCTETKEFTIDGNTWKAGVYFYSISTEGGLLQGKIVKE